MVCAAVQREREDRQEPGGGLIKYFYPLLFGRAGQKGKKKMPENDDASGFQRSPGKAVGVVRDPPDNQIQSAPRD